MKKSEFIFYAACVCVFLITAGLWADSRIISPVPGIWNNKQCLVVDTSDGADCYYSLSGSDPLTSGFVYDGPILIDSTENVKVRVAVVNKDASSEEYEVSYTVKENSGSYPSDTEEASFVKDVLNNGLFVYTNEEDIYIPSKFKYTLSSDSVPLYKGRRLYLDISNRLSRYVPCVVTDGSCLWRFVVFVTGSETGLLARQNVPFDISNWDTLTFRGEKLIWCLDDGLWSADKNSVTIDRSIPHTVYWQSMAYEQGNPVQSFVIPEKPSLTVDSNSFNNNCVTFGIEGDMRYRMEIIESGVKGEQKDNPGLFTRLSFDVFEGEAVKGNAIFAIYCDGVYNGLLAKEFAIDKKPPQPPVFKPSLEGSLVRDSVSLTLSGEDNNDIYFAVSEGVRVKKADYDTLSATTVTGDYRLYTGREIALGADQTSPVFYKVSAYSKNTSDNHSSIADYCVIIDTNNFYVDEKASPLYSDGSLEHPYTDIAQALEHCKNSSYANIYISGNVHFPSNETLFTSGVRIIGKEGACVTLPPSGFMTVRGTSLEISDCVVEREGGNGKITEVSQMFVLEDAVLNLKNCEVAAAFSDNGTVFTANSSVIDIVNSGVTVKADSYACSVSAINSKINVRSSRMSSVAYTAVNFSIQGGTTEIRSTDCKVVSHIGRVAELTRTNIRLTANSFTGEFDKKTKGLTAVWADDETLVLENTNNTISGF